MKAQNRGKNFESQIRSAFENLPNVSFDRLPDPMAGYSGIKNICDFSMFCSPDMFYIECKSLYGNTLNYAGAITKNQWNGMLEKSKILRCVAGVVVWYIDHDVTAFVPIQELQKHRDAGNKSLNIKDITGENSVKHILFDGKKKIVMYNYNGEKALKKLHELSNEIWNGGE